VKRKGRKPLATGHVERCSGSELAKLRLTMILKTMLGELTVAEACAELGIGESRFHAQRNQWIQEALALLEPRRMGRPPKVEDEQTRRVAELEAALQQTRQEAETAEIRREIAEILPRTVTIPPGPEPGKKRGTRRRKSRRRPR
jgi:hypothetical protein